MTDQSKVSSTDQQTAAADPLPPPSSQGRAGQIDVSVIVVNYNTGHLLKDMWDALMRSRGRLNLQVIFIDNASRDDSVMRLRRDFAEAQLIFNETNVGFGRANNQGLALATGRYVLLLNTDAFVAPDTLGKTVDYMEAHRDCGILGVRLIGREGELQPSCRYFPTPWNVFLARTGLTRFFPAVRMVDDLEWDHASIRECDWVVGCYYLVRREVIDQVGLFDPRYFLYCEEVDHCRAAKRAGWRVIYFPETSVVHLGGESAKSDAQLTKGGRQISAIQLESELLYFRKHNGLRGAILSAALSFGSDGILALKALRMRQRRGALTALRSHASALLAAIVQTRFGRHPTR